MCGRYTLKDPKLLKRRFSIHGKIPEIKPNYNTAPGQIMPVIVNHGEGNVIEMMRWGLIPVWAKDDKIGYKMINARAETLDEKPTWKRPLKSQRCIIPASGFYEWQKHGSTKQPFYIHLPDSELMGFAGLFDTWHDPAGNEVRSYSIITTTPNSLMKPIHDRMPAILHQSAEDSWIDPAADGNTGYLESLLRPYTAKDMDAYEVSDEVNKPQNNRLDVMLELSGKNDA
jgi:putative SOS response-associated peptidase YedK